MNKLTSSSMAMDPRLFLTQERFKRTCKHLKKHLDSIRKLQNIQEALAQSLSFHHFHELQQVWSTSPSPSPSFHGIEPSSSSFFTSWMHRFDPSSLSSFFSNFIEQQESMWKNRAQMMMNVMVHLLSDLHLQGKSPATLQALRSLFQLPFFISCLTQHASCLSSKTLDLCYSYLQSLPGHSMPFEPPSGAPSFMEAFRSFSIHQTTMEQHGYLSMQWTPVFELLASVEVDDTVIFRWSWFESEASSSGQTSFFIRRDLMQQHPQLHLSWLGSMERLFFQVVPRTTETFLMSDLLEILLMTFSAQNRRQLVDFIHCILQRYGIVTDLSKALNAS